MKIGKEELTELMLLLGEAGKYLDVGEEIVKGAKPTVVRALKLVLNTVLDVGDELEKELARLSVMTARSKRRAYQDYVKSGFTPEQAFSLVLASVKPVNFTEMLNKTSGLSGRNDRSEPGRSSRKAA